MTSQAEVWSTSDSAEADALAAQHQGWHVEEVTVPGSGPDFSYGYLIPDMGAYSYYVVRAPDLR